MFLSLRFLLLLFVAGLACGPSSSSPLPQSGPPEEESLVSPPGASVPPELLARLRTLEWTSGGPILSAPQESDTPFYSAREPTALRHQNRWHLFVTLVGRDGVSRLGHTSLEAADEAPSSPTLLSLEAGRVSSPQIMYLSFRDRWLLLFQQEAEGRYRPFFVTAERLGAGGWSEPTPLPVSLPPGKERVRDYYLIGAGDALYLFFTSEEGLLWRSKTSKARFPAGWSKPAVALRAGIYRAPHIYRLEEHPGYLAMIEAHSQWRRYQKAYYTDDLTHPWQPAAVTRTEAFASRSNVEIQGEKWTDSFSHGEILRIGSDETMRVSLSGGLRMLFQGVRYRERDGKLRHQVPWKIGLLESMPAQPGALPKE